MADIRIRMRPNGPFVVEGPMKLVDSDGAPFETNPDKPVVALCRCGASAKRPFCDGAHNRIDFTSDEKAVGDG